jgi:hypothetical protein
MIDPPPIEEWNTVQTKRVYQSVNDHIRDHLQLTLGVMPDWFQNVVEMYQGKREMFPRSKAEIITRGK